MRDNTSIGALSSQTVFVMMQFVRRVRLVSDYGIKMQDKDFVQQMQQIESALKDKKLSSLRSEYERLIKQEKQH